MESIVIILRPRDNFFVVCWIRIYVNYYLRPFGSAIIPGRIGFADARRSAINRIQMHRGMHRRKRFTKRNVLGDGFIAQRIEEIGAPIPLEARRIEGIEHTLQCGMGNRSYKIERRLLEGTDGLESLFCLLLRSRVRPDYAAHFFHVQIFRKRRCRWHSKKCKEAIKIIWSPWNKLAIPFHDVGCFAQFIEHRATIEYVDRMQLERKRSYDAEIPTTASERPEQIGVFISVGLHKFAICQYDIGGEQIVDGQSAFAGQMSNSSAQR